MPMYIVQVQYRRFKNVLVLSFSYFLRTFLFYALFLKYLLGQRFQPLMPAYRQISGSTSRYISTKNDIGQICQQVKILILNYIFYFVVNFIQTVERLKIFKQKY